ncbi:hypothetical protein FACS1894200_04080 [Spirochaetia bacterium]|nr:hypothetical protein FACS1894200_04080 [Spirochaetia bacterium]
MHICVWGLAVCLGAAGLYAAEISVPLLEFVTRTTFEDGEAVMSSMASADIGINGGYKYGVLLGLSFNARNLGKAMAYQNYRMDYWDNGPSGSQLTDDDYNDLVDQINDRNDNQAVLSFRMAKATARELFGSPLEFAYFIGEADTFCSGSEFESRFSTGRIATDYQGFSYFPNGIGGDILRQYDGIHGVQGTGISFALNAWDAFVPLLYLYQDFPYSSQYKLDSGELVDAGDTHYSGDLRFLYNGDSIKLEAFGGMTTGKAEGTGRSNSGRGGLLAYLSANENTGLFLQAGIPDWHTGSKLTTDNLYFLMEPRLKFSLLSIYVTFFYHPVEYIHVYTKEEKGKADLNFKLFFGTLETSGVEGGIETTACLQMNEVRDTDFYVSPFVSIVSTGLRWDLKLRTNLTDLNNEQEGACAIFIGVRTAF